MSNINEILNASFSGEQAGDAPKASMLEGFTSIVNNWRATPDLIVETQEQAMDEMAHLIGIQPPDIKWALQMTPFVNGACDQDIYLTFVQWSREISRTKKTIVYNVTNAFKRLEAYVNWMEHHREDLSEPKLTEESIQEAKQAWGIECHHDKKGRYVWFLDVNKLDLEKLSTHNAHAKKRQQRNYNDASEPPSTISIKDSLRCIVYTAHVMLFDKQAQENGMVFVQSMGYKGMMESINELPGDVMAKKLDKFTMGTLPIKLKSIYILNAKGWVRQILALMKPFLAQKLRDRIVMLDDKNTRKNLMNDKNPLEFLKDDLLGPACIPEGFGCFGGGRGIVDLKKFTIG